VINEEGTSKDNIALRSRSAKVAFVKIKEVLKLKWVHISVKSKLIRTFVLPALFYACGTWKVTAAGQKALLATLCYVLRPCLGLSLLDRVQNSDVMSRSRLIHPGLYVASRRITLAVKLMTAGADRLYVSYFGAEALGGNRISGRVKAQWEARLPNDAFWCGIEISEAKEISRQFREGRDIGDGSLFMRKLSLKSLSKLSNARKNPYQQPERVKEIVCDQCDAKFAEFKELNRHRRDAHLSPQEGGDQKEEHEFRCTALGCTKSYKARGWLQRHWMNWRARNGPDPHPPYPPPSPGPISRQVVVSQSGTPTGGGGIQGNSEASASSWRGDEVVNQLAAADMVNPPFPRNL
jgi:hypothetical protein